MGIALHWIILRSCQSVPSLTCLFLIHFYFLSFFSNVYFYTKNQIVQGFLHQEGYLSFCQRLLKRYREDLLTQLVCCVYDVTDQQCLNDCTLHKNFNSSNSLLSNWKESFFMIITIQKSTQLFCFINLSDAGFLV